MARRIRWQILTTLICGAIVLGLISHLALATTAQGDPTQGGTYREGLVGQVNSLNPLRGTQQTTAEADLTALIFEGLTRVETTGVVAPTLASGWQISPDQRTYTVTLRPDVRWHDGVPFSADDVVWTISWIQSDMFDGDPALAALWRNIRLTPIDTMTLRFDLPAPFAPFPSQMAVPITPAHILRAADPAARAAWAERPVGTGAYRLADRQPTQLTLTAVENYRPGTASVDPLPQPNLDTLEFWLYPTLQDAQAALSRDTVDALTYNVTERGELPLPVGYERVRAPLADYIVLTYNLRQPLLQEQNLRQALSYAVDPQAVIAQALNGLAVPLTTPILPSSWAHAAGLTPYVDDAEHSRASSLLDKVGWERDGAAFRQRNGSTLHFTLITGDTDERQAVANVVADQLATVGISTTVEPLSASELDQRLSQHDFDLAIHGWSNLGSDPDVYELWHSSQVNAANVAGLADPTIDELLVQGRQTSDLETRSEIYQQFQERWLALAPAVMLYQPLLEEQFAPSIQVLGLSADVSQSEVLYRPADRFRRLANWYQVNTRQIRSDLRQNPVIQRPR